MFYPIIIIFLFVTTNFAMEEKITTNDLIEQAWQAGYQGDLKKAQQLFRSAASKKSSEACLILASSSQKGSPLTNLNTLEADSFKQQAMKLVYEGYIDRAIEKKTKDLRALDFAVQHPWYHTMTNLFKKYSKTEPFRLPVPEEGFKLLTDKLIQGNLNSPDRDQFLGFIKQYNHDNVYQYLLKQLQKNKGGLKPAQEIFPPSLALLQDWAVKNKKSEQLVKAYELFIKKMRKNLSYPSLYKPQEINNNIASIIKIIPGFYQLAQETAHEKLCLLLNHILKPCIETTDNGGQTQKDLLQLMLFISQKDPALFEKYYEEIMSDHLEDLLRFAIDNPEIMESYAGTPFALATIMQRVFKEASISNNNSRAFTFFLRQEKANSLHEAYQKEIIQTIPLYTKENHSRIELMIELTQSTIPAIRHTVGALLLEYFVKEGNYLLGELLDLPCSDVFEGTEEFPYQQFYNQCKERNNIASIQPLWLHLAQSNDLSKKELLHRMVTDFFNLNDFPYNPSDTYETIFKCALKKAATQKSVPRDLLIPFLYYTIDYVVLKKIIPSSFTNELLISLFADETVECQWRASILDRILESRHDHKMTWQDLLPIIDNVQHAQLKEYATTLLQTFNPEQTSYQYFALRKKLYAIHQQENSLNPNPSVLSGYLKYYNALKKMSAYQLAKKLIDPALDREMIFGYRYVFFLPSYGIMSTGRDMLHSCRLYAFNAKDGNVVWASPIDNGHSTPFIMSDNNVYQVTDGEKIVVLNKSDGSYIKSFYFKEDEPIEEMAFCKPHYLITRHHSYFTIINTQTEKYEHCPVSPDFIMSHIHIVGSKVIITASNKSSLIILDLKKNSGYCASLNKTPIKKFTAVTGNDNIIVCIVNEDCCKNNLFFLDASNGALLFECAVDNATMQCSPDGSMLYIAESKFYAIDMKSICPPKLTSAWHLDRQIGKFCISEDGKYIYGTAACTNMLYKIDAATGALCEEHQTESMYRMLGIVNDTPYLYDERDK